MRLLSVLLLLTFVSTTGFGQTKQEQLEFFEQRIRPVLVEHCYECHNTVETSEAGLALDWQGGIQKGSDSGSVLSGKQESLLLQVMKHEIDGLEMPEGGPKLDDRVIKDFQRWLSWGAPDPRDQPPTEDELEKSISWDAIREKRKQWWSFQPIQAHEPPVVDLPDRYEAWAQNPIDPFVFEKQAERGLSPSMRASKQKLAQRIFLTLTGLPPTPVELRDFVSDASDQAISKLVDRLLDSPQFGERWARHWMDWVRYAESHGSEGDPKLEGAEHYRDYLIRALNSDVGYDQLLKEHVAGDLLAEPRVNSELGINESIIGTAHWRMVFHGFAPTDALDEKVRFTDDAINVFSKAFLGLTVSCARCHDHKFDAISQADYYALFGILASTRPGRSAMTIDVDFQTRAEAMRAIKQEIRQSLATEWKKVAEGTRPSVGQFLGKSIKPDEVTKTCDQISEDYSRNKESDAQAASAATICWDLTTKGDAEDWYAVGPGLVDAAGQKEGPSAAGEFIIEPEGERLIQGVLPSGVYSHRLSNKLGARLTSPDFKLDRNYRLYLELCGGGNAMSRYVVQNYPRNGTVFPVTDLRSNFPDWRWQAYKLDYWLGDDAHIELTTANDAPLLVKNNPRSWFGVRRALLLPEGAPAPPGKRLDYLQSLVVEIAKQERKPESEGQLDSLLQKALLKAISDFASSRVTDDQSEFLDRCLRTGILPSTKPNLAATSELVDSYRKLEAQIPVATRVPTLAEWKGADHPLYERGNHKNPGEIVPRRFLEAIDSSPYQASLSGRFELANDLLREDNPFTARVIVNRVWTHLFGRGLVETPDNFGRLGAEPTHPELLDYLATSFRTQDHWSIKSLIRRIVLSETWMQDSAVSSEKRESDPANRFYARYPVRRLEAEAIRDKLLSVAGSLDPASVGSPVNGNSNRRSVYVRVKRNALDPFLTTFDAPVPFSTTGLRPNTNVPAQSLMMLNSQFVQKLAASWGDAIAKRSHLQPEQAVRQMWVRAFGREPTRFESQAAMNFLESSQKKYEADRALKHGLDVGIRECQTKIAAILEPAKTKITANKEVSDAGDVKDAIAVWTFEDAAEDRLELKGSAKLQDGQLVLDGKGWAESKLAADLTEKTLEVIVQLDALEQRGGGAMSVQSSDGVIFDALVFGEQQPKVWLAGSNNFKRTKPFPKATPESVDKEPVHLVLSYRKDGQVVCYRNGSAYGQPYKTSLQGFGHSNAVVSFGIRHGRNLAQGRMLVAKVHQARLYDRALTAQEAKAAYEGQPLITKKQIVASLGATERSELERLENELAKKEAQLSAVKEVAANQHFHDLAHAIFNMKEFIYVQ